MKKGFTLAEVMIVLAVIGILVAILLPTAQNTMPNKNIMKFKKAHNTLYVTIRELVNSDEYYSNGDFGKKSNGDAVNSATYFCETISDMLNVEKVNCVDVDTDKGYSSINIDWLYAKDIDYSQLEELLALLDLYCKKTAKQVGQEILLNNDIVFYDANPAYHYNSWYACPDGSCFSDEHKKYNPSMFYQTLPARDEEGNPLGVWADTPIAVYKTFCIDIDGIPTNATVDDCVNECPFGYGIRVDGKILNGTRASEWLKKDIQEKE